VQVLHPDNYLPFVISLPHRLKLIERLDVTACIVVRFTKRFSQLTAHEFIEHYLVGPLQPGEIFVGRDFRFGKNRSGTLEYLKEAGRTYGFQVNVISPVKGGQRKIGSSRIRRLITEGKLYAAKQFLGREFSTMGRVVKGDGRGRALGFPTVNIRPQNAVIPPVGVYAVRVVIHDERYHGMANIGRRPSFKKKGSKTIIEAHIFDFHKTLYSQEIIIEFVQKIRNEKIFHSKEKLIAQLKRDEIKSRAIL
jgi:riboflavin kinase/FMN adenylyltransferase